MTNYDKIMEELAVLENLALKMEEHSHCAECKIKTFCDNSNRRHCHEVFEDWLQQEVED